MKLQYRCNSSANFSYHFELYHNGALAKTYKVWLDSLDEELERLEDKGYTYGYTKEEVDHAKAGYEKMLKGLIYEGV